MSKPEIRYKVHGGTVHEVLVTRKPYYKGIWLDADGNSVSPVYSTRECAENVLLRRKEANAARQEQRQREKDAKGTGDERYRYRCLSPREVDVLSLWLGRVTIKAIAEQFGVTSERIRQIHCKALRKLKLKASKDREKVSEAVRSWKVWRDSNNE